MKTRTSDKGFTLIEIMIAIILIGIAIAGIVAANGSLTKLNGAAVELSTAEFLIEQIRERTTQLGYTTLKNLDDVTYTPPIDSQGAAMSEYSEFSQFVTADYLQEDDLTQISGSATKYIRISVDIIRDSRLISTGSWIRADYH